MANVYEMVTAKLINELEQGKIPWLKPWSGTNRSWKRVTGEPYSLLNQFLLPPGEYASFKQIESEGGKVNKGAKGYMVVFYKLQKVEREVETENGTETKTDTFPILRYYKVFNIETQTDLAVKHPPAEVKLNDIEPLENCESTLYGYIEREGVNFETMMCGSASYSEATDTIRIPIMRQFVSAEEYYSTAFHEAAHSTGHRKRLGRIEENAFFGSEDYSKEELVAEITSAAVMNSLGVDTEGTFRNSAAYIQGWIKALKNDKRLIVHASTKADKAFEMIIGGNKRENSNDNKELLPTG